MQTVSSGSQTEEKPSQRSQKKKTINLAERPFLTPTEFASLFGKQKIWAYRLIYAQKIKVIKELGDMMIPRSELKRIEKKADYYSGRDANGASDKSDS
jgi:hypothetical protein